jgi:hypothetical protein
MGETLQICKRICTTEEASHLLELLRATYQTLGPGSVTSWAELCLRIGGGCNLSSPDQSHKEFLLIQVMC